MRLSLWGNARAVTCDAEMFVNTHQGQYGALEYRCKRKRMNVMYLGFFSMTVCVFCVRACECLPTCLPACLPACVSASLSLSMHVMDWRFYVRGGQECGDTGSTQLSRILSLQRSTYYKYLFVSLHLIECRSRSSHSQ